MYTPGTNTDRLVVLLDVPKKLEQALAKGMKKIGPRCLRENAEVVLKIFEDMCLEHVVGQDRPSRETGKQARSRSTDTT